MLVLPYPHISPVVARIGPIELRWYGLMYLVGYVVGFFLVRYRIRRGRSVLTERQLDMLIVYLFVGMFLGARLTYVLVYNWPFYRAHPWQIFAVWEGGLSFHGALVGMAAATALFTWRHRLGFLAVGDTLVLAGTPGLFFGRLGNFINGELYGRPTHLPWAMVFPDDPAQVPRHPSELYEAVAEGLLLAAFLWWLDRRARRGQWYRAGLLSGAFLVGYGAIRFLLEFTRSPDRQLGLILGPFSMGQLLSLPMILIGAAILLAVYAPRGNRRAPEAPPG
jgi:phosphatidylglycerol:prolipoprotein diacylglycerol transferase